MPGHNKVRIAGACGVVRWGYQVAAKFGAWSYDGVHFRAQLIERDAFRMSQSGLRLEAQLTATAPPQADRPIVWLHVSDDALTARLGPRS